VKYILDRRDEFGRFLLFFGSRSPEEQLFKDDLAEWRIGDGVEYFESVDRADDKWRGRVGVITTLFDDAGKLSPDTKVVICGPPVMYKFVLGKLLPFGITDHSVFVDLERRMKCGIGKCGHCQLNDKYVCTDGPVFRYSEVRDLEEALS
jgi:NAD(P)H-flavin reductase